MKINWPKFEDPGLPPGRTRQTDAELLDSIKAWERKNANFLAQLPNDARQAIYEAREHVEVRISKDKARRRKSLRVINGGKNQ
jgi:hypothetical protein